MKKGKTQPETIKSKEEKLNRRKFLMSAAAMAGAVAANAIPGNVEAADGDSLKIGQKNVGTSTTQLESMWTAPTLKLINTSIGGPALTVDGTVNFSTAGRGIILKGDKYAPVFERVTKNSQILVTLQGSAGSGVYLSHVKRMDTFYFRVVLNKVAARDTKFAYFIIN